MATIVELARASEFELFEPELRHRQQVSRLLYGRGKVWEWITNNLPEAESEYGLEVSPFEQLEEVLNAFCAGEQLIFERQIKPLHHTGFGVWEIKTLELRLFGWFPSKDVFVACSIDFATRIKTYNLYGGYRDEVIRFRDILDLDPPKFIPGEDPRGVATNISVP